MKHLKIIYTTEQGDQTLFDSEIQELVWSDTANGVKVEGRTRPGKPANAGGFLEMLSGLSKAKTEQMVAEKREELEPELVEESV